MLKVEEPPKCAVDFLIILTVLGPLAMNAGPSEADKSSRFGTRLELQMWG